jgi:hypothetical protein
MCETSAPLLLETLEATGYSSYTKPPTPFAGWTYRKIVTVENTMKLKALNSPLRESYSKTLECGSVLMQNGDTFSFWKCKKKWCSTCSNIRTADLINGFKHLLEDFKAPHLVVLTMKNCKGRELESRYKKMVHAIKLANRNIKKTHGTQIHGIRTWESTYNTKEDEYHPHFNVIVDGKEIAELLRSYWMNYWNRIKPGYSSIKGQSIEPISSPNGLLEVFKYVTKLSVSHDEEVKAQDWIFQCTKGKRLAQPFGKLKRIKIEDREEHTEVVDTVDPRTDMWFYEHDFKTYRNGEGECLATDEEIKEYKKERIQKKKKNEARYKPK